MSQADKHNEYWTDLLTEYKGISWYQIWTILTTTGHGFSNYEKCMRRDHVQVRQDVMGDEKVRKFTSKSPDNAKKVHKVLDEMCHLLSIQTNPTRKLRWAGPIFMRYITTIYTSIYVSTHLLQLAGLAQISKTELFKAQFLKLSRKMPVVILPTHRSYLDFLLITYVMFMNELPLPIVAAGDNFKALGSILTNYLKATGAFLVRRNANNKRDIEANDYYDILRAYVHSIIVGGENPLEFFMEGTRTRLGQVLSPKTGLLSMVVDMYLQSVVDDICILPVTINYQRPIEEQLYVNEMTPQISKSKPRETAKNLLSALDKISTRNYGKVYVRFLEPFKLSDYHKQWNQAMTNNCCNSFEDSIVLHDLTNSLASRVCIEQANANILMPFNLITYSILARSFLLHLNIEQSPIKESIESTVTQIPIADVAQDFLILEDLLKSFRSDFVAGWKGHLDIFDEFKLNRDEIIRASSDRRMIEFDFDARTFHTFSYYGNQVKQILLPVAISLLLSNENSAGDEIKGTKLEQYKSIRSLLQKEFLVYDMSLEVEFTESSKLIGKGLLCLSAKEMLLRHLSYSIDSYLVCLRYLQETDVLERSEFFQSIVKKKNNCFISKDMLNNVMNFVKDMGVCRSITEDEPGFRPTSTSKRREEQIKVQSRAKLSELVESFQDVLNRIHHVEEPKKGKLVKLNERFKRVLHHVNMSK